MAMLGLKLTERGDRRSGVPPHDDLRPILCQQGGEARASAFRLGASAWQRFAEFLRSAVTYLVGPHFHGYNLVRHAGRFHGLSLALRAVDLSRTPEPAFREWQRCQLCIVADDLGPLKQEIEQSGFRGAPELIEQDFHGFNLVAFRDKFLALATVLGPGDLAAVDPKSWEVWQTLEQVGTTPGGLIADAGPRPGTKWPLASDRIRHGLLAGASSISVAKPTSVGWLDLQTAAIASGELTLDRWIAFTLCCCLQPQTTPLGRLHE